MNTAVKQEMQLKFQSQRLKNYFNLPLYIALLSRKELTGTGHKTCKMQRLTSLVYHLAFPLELLFAEFVAILFLGLQDSVKKVKTTVVTLLIPY